MTGYDRFTPRLPRPIARFTAFPNGLDVEYEYAPPKPGQTYGPGAMVEFAVAIRGRLFEKLELEVAA